MTQPTNDLEALAAKAIIGPHLPVPEVSKYSLEELREIRWNHLSEQQQGYAKIQARAVLTALRTIAANGDKDVVIAELREALRHAQGRFLNINIGLTTNRSKGVDTAIRYADVGEDCIKMLFDREAALVRGADNARV